MPAARTGNTMPVQTLLFNRNAEFENFKTKFAKLVAECTSASKSVSNHFVCYTTGRREVATKIVQNLLSVQIWMLSRP